MQPDAPAVLGPPSQANTCCGGHRAPVHAIHRGLARSGHAGMIHAFMRHAPVGHDQPRRLPQLGVSACMPSRGATLPRASAVRPIDSAKMV